MMNSKENQGFTLIELLVVCAQTANKAADPGRADINWTYNGQPVP